MVPMRLVAPTCALASSLICGAVTATTQVSAGLEGELDRFIRAEMENQMIPGVAVGIVRKGEVILAQGYGQANVEHGAPVTRATIFQSGSVGKQFTAVAVMLQVEDGKLALDDSITKYFTDAPASWRPITVAHLLAHTSGIQNYEERPEASSDKAGFIDYQRNYTEEDLARFAYGLPLEFEPGSRWNYSNTGYVMLGILVRKLSGKFYGDVLGERVFAPLEMKSARVIAEADIIANRSAGYRLVDGALKNQEWVSPSLNSTADGSLYLSLDDLLAWDRGLRAGSILKAESWQRIYAPTTLNSGKSYPYNAGWVIDNSSAMPWHYHGGAWQGFKAFISRYGADDLTILVLANLADADPERFVDGIARLVDPRLAMLEPNVPISDAEPAVTERVRKLLENAAVGTLGRADFPAKDPETSARKERLEELVRPLGALQSLDLLERRELGDDRVSTYRATYPDGVLSIRFGLSPEGRVALLEIWPR